MTTYDSLSHGQTPLKRTQFNDVVLSPPKKSFTTHSFDNALSTYVSTVGAVGVCNHPRYVKGLYMSIRTILVGG